jgi:hypothetical protein
VIELIESPSAYLVGVLVDLELLGRSWYISPIGYIGTGNLVTNLPASVRKNIVLPSVSCHPVLQELQMSLI